MGTISYDFSGAVVVVTGGARGQGLSHALAFARSGARVVAIDCSTAPTSQLQYPLSGVADLRKAEELLREISPESTALDLDIRDERAHAKAAEEIGRRYRQIDCLVHNAGVNIVKSYEATTCEDWDTVHATNLRAPFFLTQHLAPLFNPTNSSVVFISSLAAIKGVPKQAMYAASKAGILALTRSMAVELGPRGVRVNAICPSLVVSPQSVGLTKAMRATGEKVSPPSFGVLAGVGTLRPDDVTQVVLWLASRGAGCITGQVIVADAGRSL